MKKNVLLSEGEKMTMQMNAMEWTNTLSARRMLTNMIVSIIANIGDYYSSVLEYKLNNKQTMLILNAQFAFLFTVFPIECSPIIRILCMIWLVAALLSCRKSGIRTSD